MSFFLSFHIFFSRCFSGRTLEGGSKFYSLLRSRYLSRHATLLPTNGCSHPSHIPLPILANHSLGAIFRTLSRQIRLLRLVQSETVFYLSIVTAITGKISQIKMAVLEEAFHLASSKFKISELNAYQKLAIRKIVVEKEDLFVNLPTGSGKSLIYQALPLVFDHVSNENGHIFVVLNLEMCMHQ